MEKSEAFLCPFCGAPYRELIPSGTVQVKCHYCGATVLVPPRLGGAVQRCPSHPEILAVSICNGCGGNFCGDCLFFVKTYVSESRQPIPEYSYFCSDCIKRKGLKGWREPNQALTLFGLVLFIIGFIIIAPSPIAGLMFWIIGLGFVFAGSGEEFRFPTVRRVMEKMSELNKRAEKIKDAMTPQEVEELYSDLYRKMLVVDYHTGIPKESNLDRLLEEYTRSGLSRKEAIFRIASKEGVEIRPGLHISPTVGDALSELKEEMKKAELVELMERAKISGESKELYEKLRDRYMFIHGSGSIRLIENKIKPLMKKGLSREEAICKLAEKEGLVSKGNENKK